LFVDDNNVVIDHCWFKGGWWDSVTLAWKNIQEARLIENPPVDGPCPGASLFLPFTLKSGQEKTIRLMFAWYVPKSDMRLGKDAPDAPACEDRGCCSRTYVPWYAGRFKDIKEVARYWRRNYDDLRHKTALFRDIFYDSTIPGEVIEVVAANLTILKSPTVLRQTDGRLWFFEGCSDDRGCCHGSCTHVWNYAQAIPHLFPSLERSLHRTRGYLYNFKHDLFDHANPQRPAFAMGKAGGLLLCTWPRGGQLSIPFVYSDEV
jgi:hypothetical protein